MKLALKLLFLILTLPILAGEVYSQPLENEKSGQDESLSTGRTPTPPKPSLPLENRPASFTENPEIPRLPKTDDSVHISADHVVENGEADTIMASGRVELHYQNQILRADKVKVNNKTKIGQAVGHVLWTRPDGTWLKSQRMLFDLKSQKGKSYKAKGRMGEKYYVTGKEVTRLTENHYQMTESSITTCEGLLPDWIIETKTMDVVVEDRALFTGGWLKVRDIPILYIPAGYIPVSQKRKSGFLFPDWGVSREDGFLLKTAFYWAIDDHSDATFYLDHLEKRGEKVGVEYRYTPSETTVGQIDASYLEDNLIPKDQEGTFWNLNWIHEQELPQDVKFRGKLDLVSDNDFDQRFQSDNIRVSRRNTESFATMSKSWSSSSLDFVARSFKSTEIERDDSFSILPQITHTFQRQQVAESPLYFNMESSFSSLSTDLDPSKHNDDKFEVERIDMHPQVSLPINIAPWLTITPTLGVRETLYSRGINNTETTPIGGPKQRTASFVREMLDANVTISGPKFQKIYPDAQIKHLIEPTFSYSLIPETDEEDRFQIQALDGIDSVGAQNTFSYGLTQRLLKKEALADDENFQVNEILRFSVSQSYDIRTATHTQFDREENRKPFSELRFDLDSRITDALLFNTDLNFNVYDDAVTAFNFEVGVKPANWLMFIVERRYTRNNRETQTPGEIFLNGTLDILLPKGLRFQYTTRYDELIETFRENDFSLMYDDKCNCWGVSVDVVQKNLISGSDRQEEIKALFSVKFRGLGSYRAGGQQFLPHRRF